MLKEGRPPPGPENVLLSNTKASISAGIAGSAAGVPFNMVQALFGIVIALLIYPVIWPAIQRQQSSASRPAA